MRTKDGLEEFLDYRGSITDFFVNALAARLGLENQSVEDRNIIIRDYLREYIIDNGFVCHTTNSLSAEEIMKNGFTEGKISENTQDVITELKDIFPEGFFKTDLNYIANQSKRTGWFYDRSPYHYKRYSDGPEWFKRLVSSYNFTRRDYDGAKSFVLGIMNTYKQSPLQIQRALDFLDRNWDLYAPTTPHMLLISTKDCDLRDDKEINVVDTLSVQDQIMYYIELYFKGTDKNTSKQILPTDIIDIDMDDLKKKAEMGTKPLV